MSEYTTNSNIDWTIAGLNVCAISTIPIAISSGGSLNKLYVPHKIATFLRSDITGRFWTLHKTF